MLRNYLLLAVKVLARRKFYTFISLFGIALTLMVLILLTSLIESFVHPPGPERDSERILLANFLMLVHESQSGGFNRTNGALGYRFIEDHLLDMETPELVSVFTDSTSALLGMGGNEVVGFKDGVAVSSALKRSDANYWKILQFDFLEGRPFNEEEHRQGAYVAVISESTRDRYFPNESAVGEDLVLDGSVYRVIGVVKDVSALQVLAWADIWVPLFATPSLQFRYEERGNLAAMLLASSREGITAIKEEYQSIMRDYRPSLPAGWPSGGELNAYSFPAAKAEFYARIIGGRIGIEASFMEEESTAGRTLVAFLGAFMLAFMLLPVINLVNMNISRILERASEIGVRKSFGASSSHLVRQFMAENLVVTGIGGLLGFLLALLSLSLLEWSGLFADGSLYMNYRVFALGLLYVLVFAVMSGMLPAWRMSRLDPVRALKGAL